MTHGQLFGGIFGFGLAAQWAGIKNVWYNENDHFCCEVVRARIKDGSIIDNVKIYEQDIREIGKHNLESVDIISGGDPCQPHSVAGLGKGEKDNRFLWPAMFIVIRELHPPWIVNENVDGSVANGVLDRKIDDLESEGYTCQAYNIPAEAVGALHRRQRIWLIANDPNVNVSNRTTGELHQAKAKKVISKRNEVQHIGEPVDLRINSADPDSERQQEQYFTTKPEIQPEVLSRYFGFGSNAHGGYTGNEIKSGIIRILNGLPEGMDYADRSKRIKGLGNAIVPQVAFQIFKAITEIQNK